MKKIEDVKDINELTRYDIMEMNDAAWKKEKRRHIRNAVVMGIVFVVVMALIPGCSTSAEEDRVFDHYWDTSNIAEHLAECRYEAVIAFGVKSARGTDGHELVRMCMAQHEYVSVNKETWCLRNPEQDCDLFDEILEEEKGAW